MAGMGEVKVSLVVDDSKARQTVQGFFDSIGQEKIADPFKGLDKSIEAIEKQAKQLGLTWDKTSQSFKDQSGAAKTIEQVGKAIAKVDNEAKSIGTSFSAVAKQFNSFDQAASTAAKGVKGFGALMKSTGQEIKAANFTVLGQQLSALGKTAQTAGGGFKTLAGDSKLAASELKGIGTGTASGIKGIGQAADASAQDLKDLGTNAKTTADGLRGIGSAGDAIKGVGGDVKGASEAIKNLGTVSTKTSKDIQSVSNNGKGLKALSTEAKNIGSSFSGAAKGVGSLATSTKALGNTSGGVKNLGLAVTGLATSTKSAATGFGSLGNAVAQANAKVAPLTALPQKIKPINTAMQAVGKAADEMGDDLEDAGKQGGAMSDTIVQGFQQILIGIPQGIGMALGNALLAPLKAIMQIVPQAVEEFRKLDESIRLTLEISGAGASSFGELSQAILEVSSTSAATAQEVGAIAQSLARAGFSMDEIKDAMQGVVQAAEATGTSYEQMGDIVVSALGAFQMAADEAGAVADSLVVAANSSNQSVTDLGDALKYVGPVANAVGQELDDVNLALGLLANAGIRGSSAGTSLRLMLTNLKIAAGGAGEEFVKLSKGNERFAKVLALVGGTVTDVNGELLPMEQLLINLQGGFNKLSSAEQAFIAKALVGQEGLSSFLALMKSGTADIAEFADKLENAGGTAAEQSANALKGLSGSFKLLESAASAALVEIGGMIATVLKPLVDVVTGIINVFNGLPGPLKAALGAVTGLAVAVGGLTAALALMQSAAIAAFAGQVITAVKNFTAALNAANAAKAIGLILDQATALTNALNGGLTGALNLSTKGLKGLVNALKNPGAALKSIGDGVKSATTYLSGLGAAAKPAAGALGKMGVTAGQAAAATAQMGTSFSTAAPAAQAMMVKSAAAAGSLKGVGVASAAATGGVGALGASMAALATTLLPIAAVVGGIVLAVKGVTDYYNKWKEASKETEGTTKDLSKALEEANKVTGETAEKSDYAGRAVQTIAGEYSSWGKEIENFLGPMDKFAGYMLGPMWGGLKRGLDLLGQVDEANKMRIMVAGLNQEFDAFEKGMDKVNSKINANNQQLLKLNPTSEEYGKILGQNQELINESVNTTQKRISKIDDLIKKYEEEEGANSSIVKALKNQKSELEGILVQQELQKVAMDKQAQAYKDATGEVASHTSALQTLAQEQSKLNEQYENEKLLNQVALHKAVKDGVLSEAEAKAAAAGAALKYNQDVIDKEEERLNALQEAYAAGELTEQQYATKKAEVVGEIKDKIGEAIEAENNYTDALRDAVNERLDEYIRAQQGVADFASKVNSILSSINSLGTSGIAAYKNLASEITNGRLAGIERVKSEEIKAIDTAQKSQLESLDRQKEARMRMIEQSGMSDEAKTKAKEAAEKQYNSLRTSAEKKFQADKEAAERAAEAKRKAALQEQINFEEAALNSQMKMKEAQLKLDEASAQIQNRLLIAQTQYEKMKAKNAGATAEQLQQYDDMIGLLKTNEQIIGKQFDIKNKILEVEGKTAEAAIANKAAAEGVNSAFSQTPASLGSIQSEMESMVGEIESLADSVPSMFDKTAIEIDKVEGIARDTIQRVEGAWSEFDPEGARQALMSIFGPEMATEMAEKLTSHVETAADEAGQAGSDTLLGYFGDAIPYELIKDPLVRALSDGTTEGTEAARAKVAELGSDGFIPTDQIATILGNALGTGYQGGLDALAAIPLPDELQIYSQLSEGLESAGVEGLTSAGSEGAASLQEQVGSAAVDSAGQWTAAFASWIAGFKKDWDATTSALQGTWDSLFGNADTGTLQQDLNDALQTPIGEAAEALENLSINGSLADPLVTAAEAADTIGNSGISSEVKGAASASNQLRSGAQGASSAFSSAVSTTARMASNLERAARAAERAARARFAGGPVEGGSTYTVNELGKEMFLSNSGRLSEIKAPAFGSWRAPSDGTVIPAYLANEVRSANEAMQVGVDLQSAGTTPHTTSRSTRPASTGPNYQRQMVKELRNLGGNVGGTVNNVTVTSDRPVGDAQRLLLEVNRLNRYRKR